MYSMLAGRRGRVNFFKASRESFVELIRVSDEAAILVPKRVKGRVRDGFSEDITHIRAMFA